MTVHLSIKNVPDEVAARLRRRAERAHRSLQGELMAILEAAARNPTKRSAADALARVRELGLDTPREATEIVRRERRAR